jgi:hypothetical protein
MNWDYVAGFFDGEGSLTFIRKRRGHALRWQVANTNHEVLTRMQSFLGCGHIYTKQVDARMTKPLYNLSVFKLRDVSEILKHLSNRCVVKQQVVRDTIRRMETESGKNHRISLVKPEEAAILYEELGRRISAVAKHYGVSHGAMKRFMLKHNISLRHCSAGLYTREGQRLLDTIDKEKLVNLYIVERKTLVEIGKLYGVSWATIRSFLVRSHVKIRTPYRWSATDNYRHRVQDAS